MKQNIPDKNEQIDNDSDMYLFTCEQYEEPCGSFLF